MNLPFKQLLSISILLSLTSVSHAFQPTESASKGLFGLYGYAMGQAFRLDQIEQMHPQLKDAVREARLKFQSIYGDVGLLTKTIIYDRFPNSEQVLEKIDDEVKQSTANTSDHVTRPGSAIAFLQTVEARSKGDIEKEHIKRFLNAVAFYERPEREWINSKSSFNFSDDPKAKGLKISLEAPYSWLSRESRLPNTLRAWSGESGAGYLHATIEVQQHDGPKISASLVRKLIAQGKIPRGLKPTKSAVISNVRGTEISRYPAAIFEFETTVDRLGVKLISFGQSLAVYDGDKTVILTCGVGGEHTRHDLLKSEKKRFERACFLFFNSLLIENRFN